jgi:hypothetical protein
MTIKYTDEMGKCYGKRNNLEIYKDECGFAVYLTGKEFDVTENGEIIEGERIEAVFVGYIMDIENKEIAFDNAEAEIASLV